MPSDDVIFAGVEFSSGRKPITFAALDEDLRIKFLARWSIPEVISCLGEQGKILLAMGVSARKQPVYMDFTESLTQAGFKNHSETDDTREFVETDVQGCFRAFARQNLLPRRTLEGRLQRALILYEQGLRITDPMEIFEEITRYKLLQGILPLEDLHSSRELEALAAAYIAWMIANRPKQVVVQDGLVLPIPE